MIKLLRHVRQITRLTISPDFQEHKRVKCLLSGKNSLQILRILRRPLKCYPQSKDHAARTFIILPRLRGHLSGGIRKCGADHDLPNNRFADYLPPIADS